MKVYLLEHDNAPLEQYGEVAGEGDLRFIGVFSTKKKAKKTIKKLCNKTGFKIFPQSFHIDCYDMNKTQWNEGFIAV